MSLYNEIDPFAASWLRHLSEAGHIAKGVVDERSIADLQPEDLDGHGQAHFFAGIGGWSLALRLAGVPDDARVWTGSCPCQPFSDAGRGLGTADPRHLWPVWRELIRECRPAVVLGEQVASKAGRAWLASVRADLEELGYGVGAADLCAAGAGAPHIRQRLWWGAVRLGDADSLGAWRDPRTGARAEAASCGERGEPRGHGDGARTPGADGGLPDAMRARWAERRAESGSGSLAGVRGAGPWDRVTYVPFRDGKARPVEPGVFPLAHGVPGRVGILRGAGNAIVPQVAAAFVGAFLDAVGDL